jgi:two-component system, chemotaxis family, sensor kinase CheA
MKTRMQPIGNAWGKLPRLVRDLCQASGKQIDLEMFGAETELDRQILQAIQDPLTHMVRNSADHGIELARGAARPASRRRGTIRWRPSTRAAHHHRDPRRREGARRRRDPPQGGRARAGRADVAAALGDVAGLPLHLRAGLLHGREGHQRERPRGGDGRGAQQHRGIGGAIELQLGARARGPLRIKIPLTLAILSALIVGVGGAALRDPADRGGGAGPHHRREPRPDADDQRYPFFRLRETLLPLVDLGDLLRIGRARAPSRASSSARSAAHRFGSWWSRSSTRTRSWSSRSGRMVKQIPFYSGTTILGDGRVIMILDVPSIAR